MDGLLGPVFPWGPLLLVVMVHQGLVALGCPLPLLGFCHFPSRGALLLAQLTPSAVPGIEWLGHDPCVGPPW